MKQDNITSRYKRKYKIGFLLMLTIFSMFLGLHAKSQEKPLRRPISPEQPMWLIHVDVWNWPDPQKIIDLIPEDIRPYVVMNLSLSVSKGDDGRFNIVEYGYETLKSWIRVCGDNQMWSCVQIASGGIAHLPDDDLTLYDEFFRDYPHFLGFNYAEQFWGFDDVNWVWEKRMTHFADLLQMSNKYGGYLFVSLCWNRWGQSLNPIGMLKRVPEFAEACRKYTENYVVFDKHTQAGFLSDREGMSLGAYLSGYAGQYGIRYDGTGWTGPDPDADDNAWTTATGTAPHLEHMLLTGLTVMDGPELIWTEDFYETNRKNIDNGYQTRNWAKFPQFDNEYMDLFRKVIDGTVRIPTREEVINRTKYVIIHDVNLGSSDDIYSSPETLYEGLYRMDSDGSWADNKSFFKKTGRYPTIPTVFDLDGDLANSFEYQIKKSEYDTRWPSVSDKVSEFNSVFPEEYTGDIYAGRYDNTWVIYNPYKSGLVVNGTRENKTASGHIPFKYNTCEAMDLTYSRYSSSIVREYADSVTFYLANFDNELEPNKRLTDIIKIIGSTNKPTYTLKERGDQSHLASLVTEDWENGEFTLTIEHNCAVDITINCAGTATDRLTDAVQPVALVAPKKPAPYTGPHQYEAECFDYKNGVNLITNGYSGGIRNYTGQGYLEFGSNSAAAARSSVTVLRSGKYVLKTKYSVTGSNIQSIDLYVNGEKVVTPVFAKTSTYSDWGINTQLIDLNAGKNVIEFKSNSSRSDKFYIDNIVATQDSNNGVYHFENDVATSAASTPAAELISVQSGSAGVVAYTSANSKTTNCFKSYTVGETNGTGVANLDMFPSDATDYTITWKEYYGTSEGKKGVLLRGTGDNGSCTYAEGMKQGYLFIALNNNDGTVSLQPYVAGTNGITSKPTYTSSFTINAGEPCWYRAVSNGNQFVFECSADSVNWEGASTTLFADDTYTKGATQLVWGLNANNFDWQMDNITYALNGNITLTKFTLKDFTYEEGDGPSASQVFSVSGNSLLGDVVLTAPDKFEISLSAESDFVSQLTLTPTQGELASTNIYVRMKSGLGIATHTGNILVHSAAVTDMSVSLQGDVSRKYVATSRIYNFTEDTPSTSAQTPPADNVSVGVGNDATAGVFSYTDANGLTSNVLKPYSVAGKNGTGVLNLDLFSKASTDYSVTWKQYYTTSGDFKNGMLLRGDVSNLGDASSGYEKGLMFGYLFLPYRYGSGIQFRVYKTSSATSMYPMISKDIAITVSTGNPIWYRATISGTASVSLKLEYSTDGTTWNVGVEGTDSANPYQSGATQAVWGLWASSTGFCMDDITFEGVESEEASTISVLASLGDFVYESQQGPSEAQYFNVSGSNLIADIEVVAPDDYEVSLDEEQGYSSSVLIPQTNNTVEDIPVYVRLKAGLSGGDYSGSILITSANAVEKTVYVYGQVDWPTDVNVVPEATATVVSVEYYTITGQRVLNIDNKEGIFIERKQMSDGTVSASKIFITK